MATERARTPGPNQGPDSYMRPIEGDSRDPIPFYGLSETERKKAKEKLSKAIISDISALDFWVRQQTNGTDFRVDMYVAKPEEPIEPQPPEVIVPRLQEHRQEMQRIGLKNLPPEFTLVDLRLAALIAYEIELQKTRLGEPQTEYQDYFRSINGYPPRLIPEQALDDSMDQMFDALEKTGLRFTRTKPISVQVALRTYNMFNHLRTLQDIEAHYWRFARRYRFQLGILIGEDLNDVNYQVVWKSEDKFWKAWERIQLDGNELWMNEHPRHIGEYNNAVVEGYSVHEDPHFVQGEVLRREIRRRNLDPVAGIITIPGPDSFQLEGLAQTTADLGDLELTTDGRLGVTLYRSEKRALSNGLFYVASGAHVEEVAEAIRKYMPLKSIDEIRKLLREGTTKPFERAYLSVYGISDYELLQLQQKFGSGIRSFLLRNLYHNIRTRDQIMRGITLDLESLLGYDPYPRGK